MRALGIDIGTTTVSGIVMDSESRKAEEAYTIENSSFIRSDQQWEKLQDPEIIISKVKGLLDKVLDMYKDIGVIGLTGQMHGIVYINREGTHVSPLYTWQDKRGNEKHFENKSVCEILRQQCGIQAYSGYGTVTHFYNAMTGQVPDGAESFCTVMDYLGMILTGRKRPLVHAGNAAGLGMYDVKKGSFISEVFKKMNTGMEILPEITEELEILGTYKGIPVCVAIGDNQASFLGSVDSAKDTILVNMGTGGQVSVYTEEYFSVDGIETRPFLKGSYILAGSSLCGGRAYALLERFFRQYAEALGIKDTDHYEIMEGLLRSGNVNGDRLRVDTRFAGTREKPALRGAIENIGTDNFTPAALIQGVLEGMAEELYEMYVSIENTIHIPKTKIIASGNGIRKNVFLQEIVSRRFARELYLAEQKEEAACGAAKAGLMAVEELSVLDTLGINR
ncbi:sedoheptulokinase [Murimonas intestini]|uniref:Sedoheptulokinase n=1 Tax=Murimonas intestini TaxID=1337051 RepID=A0AB73T898_9FIRM|nr:FGGY family carbohydrate kinase [Murimonas intestini]MCR1839959.1 FGGY family carbohydrate kinase [Murimonas intestini]MCR1866799.1 FGGY family carbohydrate kinase [Murimonas intestini]MCR1883632.1 FGGY family carbohydrate kinase [Murimonas intestini]